MESAMSDVTVTALRWHDALTGKPDTDTTCLLWLGDEWHAGWWDSEAGAWFDAATGGIVDGVTHWADPEGPT